MLQILAQSGSGGFNIGQVIQYVVYGVIALSILSSLFGGGAKNKKKPQGRPSRPAGRGGLTLDQIAAQRRAEVQTRLNQSGGSGGPGGPGSSSPQTIGGRDEPANLTMAERIARARAKMQYEQRARQMSQPQAGASGSPQTPRQAPSRPGVPSAATSGGTSGATSGGSGGRTREGDRLRVEAETQRARQVALQRQREAQQRKQIEAQVRAKAEAERRQLQSQGGIRQRGNPPMHRPTTTPRPLPVAPPMKVAVPHGIDQVAEHFEVHRMVTDATSGVTAVPEVAAVAAVPAVPGVAAVPGIPGARRGAMLLDFARLSNADLRRAFILKEVLDKPIALQPL